MFSDLYPHFRHFHREYTNRHVNPPEPLEPQARHNLKRAIGKGLIHLGERLTQVEGSRPVDEAA